MVAGCLAALIAGLVLVGLLSGTPLRHVVQVVPAVVALVAVALRLRWAACAALPVFAFWFLIMLGIWLHVSGLASIITGRFTVPETALSIVIGCISLVGLVETARSRARPGWLGRGMVFLSFAALQLIAMWCSLRPAVSAR